MLDKYIFKEMKFNGLMNCVFWSYQNRSVKLESTKVQVYWFWLALNMPLNYNMDADFLKVLLRNRFWFKLRAFIQSPEKYRPWLYFICNRLSSVQAAAITSPVQCLILLVPASLSSWTNVDFHWLCDIGSEICHLASGSNHFCEVRFRGRLLRNIGLCIYMVEFG